MYSTLDQIVKERVANRIQKGAMSAQQAVERLISEGKVQNDFITNLGAGGVLNSDITFSANGTVKMHFPQQIGGHDTFKINENAIGQMGEKFGVPTRYLKQLSSGQQWERDLAAKILNEHSGWTNRKRVLVRTVDDEIRGVMSDSYRRLDSMEIVLAFIEMANANGAQLADGLMTDTRVYIETLMPETIKVPTLRNGDVEMAFGARLSTSDYGNGALELRTFMMQGVCLNGMVSDSAMRTVHLGSRLPDNLAISERTYKLDTETQVSAVKDLTSGLFSKESIRARAEDIQFASEKVVDMEKELKKLQKGRMLKDEVRGVEKVLQRSNPDDGVVGESTVWKLTQAITAHARELDPNRERELQEVAGSLMSNLKR